VIAALTAVMVLIQCISQIAALFVLRRRQPNLPRPYKMFLYPIPALVALAGWIYLYFATIKSKDENDQELGWIVIWLSLAWLACGVLAFLIWACAEKTWPFGPKEIREEFLSSTSTSPSAIQ
jgi:amino acid transporter